MDKTPIGKKKVSPNSLRNLNPVKPGEVRNPKGINGWTKLRERTRLKIEDRLDHLVDKMIELAEGGDVAALRLALGTILNVQQHQFLDQDEQPMSFADLAKAAREEMERRRREEAA